MNLTERHIFFERLQSDNPHPITELNYETTFQLLIAVLLSAQATDISVNKATPALFAVAPTAETMLKLGVEGIEGYIKTIGLFRSKAKHIIATCERLITVYNNEIPNNRDDLESLAGVGRKTANVILNTAFGHTTIAVDTHVFRVANRTGLAPAHTVLGVEIALTKRIPPAFLYNAHHWLVLHGRYVCKAKKPDCHRCCVADLCQFKDKSINNNNK